MKKIALIGCGAVTELCHLPAARLVDDCIVSVLVDSNEERARELASKFQVPRFQTSIEGVEEFADSAILALPHHLHRELGCRLLENGLHVLLEKPMATTVEDCRILNETAKKHNRILGIGLIRRFLYNMQFVKWVVETEILGTIEKFVATEGSVFNWPLRTLFQFQKESGGGVLLDTGAHTLDLITWWFGSVENVTYFDDSAGGVEADCRLELQMERGVFGTVELSRTRDLDNTITIVGSRAILRSGLRGNAVTISSKDGRISLDGFGYKSHKSDAELQKFSDLFILQLNDWVASITENRPFRASGSDGLRVIELIEKCYASRQALRMPWTQ